MAELRYTFEDLKHELDERLRIQKLLNAHYAAVVAKEKVAAEVAAMKLEHITSVGGSRQIYFATQQTAETIGEFVREVLNRRLNPNPYQVALHTDFGVIPLFEIMVTHIVTNRYVMLNAGALASSLQRGLRNKDVMNVEDNILAAVLHGDDYFETPNDYADEDEEEEDKNAQ